MKLIKQTYIRTAIWIIPVIFLGSIFSYWTIKYIAYEETDEFLTYEMERLQEYHRIHNDLPEFHKMADLLPGVKYDKPLFRDTLILETGDNEMIPYRELRFSINHKGRDFTIVLRHLLLGNDDIAVGTLWIVIGIILLVSLFLFLFIKMVARKIWHPFYETLNQLTKFQISGPIPDFPGTKIDEFRQLNSTLNDLLKKITDDYRNNKEFSENVSHELQTHLAIIRATTEKLLNKSEKNEHEIKELKKIYTASTKLMQVQKSLLLLSKISNREYRLQTRINFEKNVLHALDVFEEAIQLRGISLSKTLSSCQLSMDPGLAEILINNLIKNAIKHNVQNGFINIILTPDSLKIANSGQQIQQTPDDLMTRFSKGKSGSFGIGLAIVKQICELYHFQIRYNISKKTTHKITISFREK